ncbi:ire1-related [Holotrichia oblita]|uniref:Ire1-related n=1 Tax=Holotrichia oblita TaxID=644536 RepID=A0ACB9T3J1_HOLOL|nr:ire1-related [Holotrichia oblita]
MPSKKKRNKAEQQTQPDKKITDPVKVDIFNKHFSEEEIQSIKHVLKTKDLIGVPLLIGAAILNKTDLISNALSNGCNVDIQDQNCVTPLFWAVKCKSLESIRILLLNGADPDDANTNGDHIIFTAMDSKNWDEVAFIYLWNNISSVKTMNINLLNKNGNSMLHMAVRRDWLSFIHIIIAQGINVDITNSSGVTPLMLASFRNSIGILNKLLECGAVVEKEDNNGFIALCYALSSVVSKQLPMPNAVVQKLLNDMQIKNFSIYEYLQAIQNNFENVERLKTIVSILLELLQYNEGCQTPTADEFNLANFFDSSCCSDICFEIMKKYENNKNVIGLTLLTFKVIMQACLVKGRCQEWLQNNYEDLQPFYEQARIAFFQNKINDERQKNVSEKSKEDSLIDGKVNSRKAKRRTKALKAKIARFKTAELTERLNNSSKKTTETRELETPPSKDESESQSLYDQLVEFSLSNENIPLLDEDECDIVNSIKKNLVIGLESESELLCERAEQRFSFACLDWRTKILSMPFNVKPKVQINSVQSFEQDFYLKPDDLSIFDTENKAKPKPEECIEQTKILRKLEKEKIDALRREFDDTITFIRETAAKDIQQCRTIIKKVEHVLLSHEIRGTTIIPEVCPSETVYVSITIPQNIELPSPNGAKNTLIQYMEDVLNDRQDPIEGISISVTEPQIKCKTKNYISDDILYKKEMATLPKAKPIDAKSILEAEKRTLKHAYHMQTSILNVCDESEEQNEKSKDLNFNYEKISKTMMFFNKNVYPNRPELIFTDTFVDPLKKSEDEEETSRWCTLVRSLEMMEDCQIFLNGTVRISCKEKRQSHVISTGGNFTPVELGLDNRNRPLAVKRIPKGSCVCEMIRSMLVDLLKLRHMNLLHYFACDYDANELILATPLCEYNVGQYLMLMKQNQTNLSALEVVKQFLTGLLFLHDRVDPIVHGNLKPSNIFIDMNGVVKIAEFGIHRALFKFKEAPNSSIIWFATETYRTFKQLSIMECTCASDIQVAGMLVHFLMTAGKHPYGDDMRIILKNLDKAVPQLSANDLELQDLITWMLLYEPIERPTIQQVVTHVYFWSSERKWKFILACAGLGNNSDTPAFDLEDLHVCLDKVASKDNIKGKWVQVVKKQFPKISFSNNDDTPTGLLKFIKTCIDNKDSLYFHKEISLSNYILTSFPAFALSLYRMLENSVWVKHSPFVSFYSIENIFT